MSPDVIIFLIYKMQNDQCWYCISTFFFRFYMARGLRYQTSPGSWHLLQMLRNFSQWILLSSKIKWIRKRKGCNAFNNSVKSGGCTCRQRFKAEISKVLWGWHVLGWHIICLSILLPLLTSLISDSSVRYDGYTVWK